MNHDELEGALHDAICESKDMEVCEDTDENGKYYYVPRFYVEIKTEYLDGLAQYGVDNIKIEIDESPDITCSLEDMGIEDGKIGLTFECSA